MRHDHIEPVLIPRWALTLKYLCFVAIGIAAAIAGIQTIEEKTGSTYVTWWGLGIAVCALAAAITSLRRRWEPAERWASLALVAGLSIYTTLAFTAAFVDGDSGRAALAFVLLTLTIIPGARAMQLLRRTGLPDV